jgi:hypothetical protein
VVSFKLSFKRFNLTKLFSQKKGALGVRVKATTEEREAERRILREAREKKILAAKQREEMWNN